MEGTRIISERIKHEAQKQGVKVKDILSYYEIDKNLVNKLANGKDTGTQNICKIAEYLKCSTDYLFGISDNPSREKGSLNNLSENELSIIQLFGSLSDTQQGELIGRAKMMIEQNEESYKQEDVG